MTPQFMRKHYRHLFPKAKSATIESFSLQGGVNDDGPHGSPCGPDGRRGEGIDPHVALAASHFLTFSLSHFLTFSLSHS